MYRANQNTFDSRRESGYRRGGFGDGGRGRGRGYGGRGGYGYPQEGHVYSAYNSGQQDSVNVNAAYGAAQNRRCHACYGRTPDGEYNPDCDHFYSDQCLKI